MKDSFLWGREGPHNTKIRNLGNIFPGILQLGELGMNPLEVGRKEVTSASVSHLEVSHLGKRSTFCFLFWQTGWGMPTPHTRGQVHIEPEGTLPAAGT